MAGQTGVWQRDLRAVAELRGMETCRSFSLAALDVARVKRESRSAAINTTPTDRAMLPRVFKQPGFHFTTI